MKKLFTFLMLLPALFGMAQSTVTVKFTGAGTNGSYCQLSSVNVSDVTQGWSQTLTYPDTTLILHYDDGVSELSSNVSLSQNRPNPFYGTTEADLVVAESGNATLRLIGMDGKIIAERSTALEAGEYLVKVSLADEQMAFLNVATAGQNHTVKLLNLGNGGTNGIELSPVMRKGGSPTKADGIGTFELGDLMSYTGVVMHDGSPINSIVVSHGQYNDEEITLVFNFQLPVVTTSAVSNVTYTSASCGGNVTSDGGSSVTARGVCWSTNPNPTISDSHTTDGTGTGSFTSNITGLTEGTTYYVRAYATNSVGTAYGDLKTITTVAATMPTVTTDNVMWGSSTTAYCGGEVTSDGGASVTARGVCWSTDANPTISGSHTSDGTGTGEFNSTITSLIEGTTYYVRAYATNSKGTAYGEQKTYIHKHPASPTVTTNDVTSVAYTSAVCGGNVTSNGGYAVTERGVCWSTSQNPTVSGSHTSDGTGTGSFTSNLTELTEGTTYYVRAYAKNINGTAYGEQKTFTTLVTSTPTVTTNDVTSIAVNDATCGGNVTSDGGATVTARGLCWSTNQNPTVSGSHTTNGTGTGSFTSVITGLNANTTYYVRAYATNNKGTSYGEQKVFNTLEAAPTGAVNGLFSVNSTKQVWFSKGNLQYKASTGIWQFADKQWNYVGDNNANISSSYSGWIDLFGWGTGNNPTNTSTDYYDYGTFTDWGINPISNGGNTANQWHTMTDTEWKYIMLNRTTTSGIRYAKATVNGVNGLIILPDNWSTSYYTLNYVNTTNAAFSSNTISSATWTSNLEAHGAVFVPAAGYRNGTTTFHVGTYGYYWSSSTNGTARSNYLYFHGYSEEYITGSDFRYFARSVRLVQDKELIPETAPTGAINGKFSVSGTTQVYFSQGNLQYKASSSTWSFAEHQYDFLGAANENISSTYTGWIDLFGWGTANNPTNTSTTNSDYSTFTDWGTKPISNGGNTANQWRTLTGDEWNYLMFSRPTISGIRYAKAKVNNVDGIIILPDNWSASYYTLNGTNAANTAFSTNTITLSNWTNSLEARGAVFIPAVGYRYGTSYNDGMYIYWSSTPNGDNNAKCLYFGGNSLDVANFSRCYGVSVRLVTTGE